MPKRPVLAIVTALGTALTILEIVAACDTGTAPSPLSRGTVTKEEEAADAADGAVAVQKVCPPVVLPNGAPVRVSGTVVAANHDDAMAPKPIPGAMIAVEYGGLYLEWCDLASASPYYVFGAVADDAGRFEIDVKEGTLGFHSFANGYYYSRAALDTAKSKAVALRMEILPDAQPQPTIQGAGFDKTVVDPGEAVTFSATLATWNSRDPLSDESVLVESTQSWGVELNPPARGKKDDFADGLWRRTFAAPTVPGTYTYWFSATTSQCVSTDLVSATLKVR